jgi:hypothetical protein
MSVSRRLALLALAVASLALAGVLLGTVDQLPERIATHFDGSGRPDGWASRGGYVVTMLLFGYGLAAFIIGILYASRFFPDSMVNLPNRGYWLAPARREEAMGVLLDYGLWMGALSIAFCAGVHGLILEANRNQPPALAGATLGLVVGAYVLGLLVVGVLHFAPYYRKPRDA